VIGRRELLRLVGKIKDAKIPYEVPEASEHDQDRGSRASLPTTLLEQRR